MAMRSKGHLTISRTALAFALTYLMVWGGMPAPALAEMAGEASSEAAWEASARDAGEGELASPGEAASSEGEGSAPGPVAAASLEAGTAISGAFAGDGTLALSFVAPEGGAYEFLVEGALGASLSRSFDPDEELASAGVADEDEAADGRGAPLELTADLEEGERVTLALVGEPGAAVTCEAKCVQDADVVPDDDAESTDEGNAETVESATTASDETNQSTEGNADMAALSVADVPVSEASSNIASGTWGTCPWSIDASGVLTIWPGVGAALEQVPDQFGRAAPWRAYADDITAVRTVREGDRMVVPPADASWLFTCLTNAKTIDLSGLDVSGVTDMTGMFEFCSSVEELDVSDWNTSSVTSLNGMFNGCNALKKLDVSRWDTSKVRDMMYTFAECWSLAELDVSRWYTSSVEGYGMVGTFLGCSSLKELDVLTWDTSKVESINGMFAGCSSLKYLALLEWDTCSLVDMGALFHDCSALEDLYLHTWDTSQVTSMYCVFGGCSSLKTVDISSWDTSKVMNEDIDYMCGTKGDLFHGCTSLQKVIVGSGYVFDDARMLPDATSAQGWWSANESKWYTKGQILASRSGVADTYTSVGAGNPSTAQEKPTSYGGTDWSPVYDPEWYVAHNADVARAFTSNGVTDYAKVLQHFVNHGMAEGRQGNASFVVRAYRARNLDLQKAFGTDLPKYYRHYVTNGAKEGRDASALPTTYGGIDWSPVYDPAYYAEHNADVVRWATTGSRVDFDKVLRHFATSGQREGRQGNASFVVRAYKARNLDLQKAYGNDLPKYYRHYVTNGKAEGRDASALPTAYGGVDWGPVYDPEWYVAHNADVARAYAKGNKVDFDKVLAHFVAYGQKEGRQGSASFVVRAYRARNLDLQRAYGSDLAKYYRHYVTNGRKEGRDASALPTTYGGVDWSPVYDPAWYAEHNADVVRWATTGSRVDFDKVLRHFATSGQREGRQSSATFSAKAYRARYADLNKAFGNDLAKYYRHYVQHGMKEGRSGRP